MRPLVAIIAGMSVLWASGCGGAPSKRSKECLLRLQKLVAAAEMYLTDKRLTRPWGPGGRRRGLTMGSDLLADSVDANQQAALSDLVNRGQQALIKSGHLGASPGEPVTCPEGNSRYGRNGGFKFTVRSSGKESDRYVMGSPVDTFGLECGAHGTLDDQLSLNR